MNLEQLRQDRLDWVKASRKNGFEDGIKRLLTDLYPDNAHFIYELLQNAEDAEATEVRFILKEDGIEFEHNGDRLFTLEDVYSITSMGVSTKGVSTEKDDPTSIGKFGVGFKAVFAYTSTPEIASGRYHFRIRDLVVPDMEGLPPCDLGEKETRFAFPFDNPQKPQEKARDEIEKNLRQLNESTLLFLKNIRKIEYLLPDSALGFLERRETDRDRIEILVQHPKESEPTPVVFLRFEKTVNVNDEDDKPKSCRIAVAFGMEKNQEQAWKVKPLEPGRVHIYFPAEKETSNLRFHLHAPFASTVARDSVRDCPANDELRDHLAALIAESMAAIRDQGLLTVGFLAILPNDNHSLPSFYGPIMNSLIKAFQNEKLTPMKQGGHAAANGIFRGTAQLPDIIKDKDLATILGEAYSPPLWVTNQERQRDERGRFIQQKNQDAEDFLAILGISEWTTKDLVEALLNDTGWLAEKPDNWFQQLYALLYDGELDDNQDIKWLEIVRLSNGDFKIGRECFFPTEETKDDPTFPRVAEGVYSSGTNKTRKDKSRKFLEGIGVGEVGEVERVEAILKQRYSKGSINPRKQDIKRFVTLVEKEPERANLFKDYYIFQLEGGKYGKPSAIFLDSPYLDTGLRVYYGALDGDSSRKWALSPKYKEAGIEPEKLGEFAKKVGAQTKLEPKKQTIPYKHPERDKLRDSGNRNDNKINKDYDIPELDVLLDRSVLSKSKLVWGTMNESSEKCLCAHYRSNASHDTKTANSSLVWKLRTHRWVPQKQEAEEKIIFVKPSDAVAELLPSGFPLDSGAKWLEAIEFGKTKRDREELERRKQEQSSQNYQRQETAAKEIGFSSINEVQEAKEMVELKRKDLEGFKKWQDSNKEKARFPTRQVANPERRKERFAEQHTSAPEKEYETRERTVRITRGEIDPSVYLRKPIRKRRRSDDLSDLQRGDAV